MGYLKHVAILVCTMLFITVFISTVDAESTSVYEDESVDSKELSYYFLSNEIECNKVDLNFPTLIHQFNGQVTTPNQENQKGRNPTIAFAGQKRIIEIHNEEFSSSLWYSVGVIQDDFQVTWITNERITVDGEEKSGLTPDLAISLYNSNPTIIQVNESNSLISNKLWYNLGVLGVDNNVQWQTNSEINVNGSDKRGINPSVAVSEDWVIQVNESDVDDDDIWFNTGRIVNQKIEWVYNDLVQGSKGVSPEVALMGNKVIVVYTEAVDEEGNSLNRLHYSTGTLNDDGSIKWENVDATISGQLGTFPTIAFGEDNKVIEMHTSPITSQVWVNVGVIQWPQISWKHECKWDSGFSNIPQVAYNPVDKTIAEVHYSPDLNLWINIGYLKNFFVYLPSIIND